MSNKPTGRGGPGRGQGRRHKNIEDRIIDRGKVAIRIAAASALELQRLMLFYPDVKTPEAMLEYLIRQTLGMNEARQLAPHAADEAAEGTG